MVVLLTFVCSTLPYQCRVIRWNAVWCDILWNKGWQKNVILHSRPLNFVLVSLFLVEHTRHQILLHCISQCLLWLVSFIFSWLVVAACLPCLATNMLHGKGSLQMWGGSVCCNTLGPPVKLWTTGRIGRQFVLPVHCVKFMLVTSSVSCQHHCHSEQKCLSLPISARQSHSNTSSVMSQSVMFSPYRYTDISL